MDIPYFIDPLHHLMHILVVSTFWLLLGTSVSKFLCRNMFLLDVYIGVVTWIT